MLKKLNVGLVGTYQFDCDVKSALDYLRKSIKILEGLSKEEEFNFYPITKGIVTPEDALRARKELEDKGIDFLLVQNSSISSGHTIVPLAHIDARLGLWSIPESTLEGPFPPIVSFVGMNMYSSIIGHYLKPEDISFKWFFGMPDTKIFLDRFRLTVRVLTALKSLASSRLCLIGKIPPGFNDLYSDERALQARYKVSICQSTVSCVLKKAKREQKSKVADLVRTIKKEGKNVDVASESFEKTARVYLALEDLAKENSYDAMAIQCWPDFEDEYQLAPCSAIALLNQNNIVAACESDVPGAISMLLLNYLNSDRSTLMDLVSFDTQDDSVLMWHCGPTARCWADGRGVEYRFHVAQKTGMVSSMVFAPGDTTIMRIIDEGENIFLTTAKIMRRDKKSYAGSRGWLGSLKMARKEVSALDFVNTVIVHRVPHHFPLAKGNLYDELMEAASWLKIKPVQAVTYEKYIQNPNK